MRRELNKMKREMTKEGLEQKKKAFMDILEEIAKQLEKEKRELEA